MRAGLLVVATVLAAAEVRAAKRQCEYADVKAHGGSSEWAFQLADCTGLHLSLSIGGVGAWALAEALKTNTKLTELNLYSNSIGAWGAWYLAEALKTNTKLTKLSEYFHVDSTV